MENARDKKIRELESELENLKVEISSVNKSKSREKNQKKDAKVIYKWKSPSRVFRKWEKEKLFTVFLWLLVIVILLLFVKQYITIFVVFALGFVIYAMTNFSPETVEHVLTDSYLVWFEKEYNFDDLKEFWFSERSGQIVLNVETKYRIPARLVFLVSEKEKEELYGLLSEYIPYKELSKKQNLFSKLIDGEYINLEK
jgi:magnesium-transporting ATPase (P-type)